MIGCVVEYWLERQFGPPSMAESLVSVTDGSSTVMLF